MRRADRLFQIIQLIRHRRITTASWLAEELEVSERTVYRDISDLMVSGVPIEGEAGVGYILRKGFDLPPLMFDHEEIAALSFGARTIQSWGDPALAKSAERALRKIEAVLPESLKHRIEHTPLFSPMTRLHSDIGEILANLRSAIGKTQKVSFRYTRLDGEISQRSVWPLGLFFWGQVWTLGAWCELREQHRSFRLDRMHELKLSAETYPRIQGRELKDFLKLHNCQDS